MRVRSSFFRMAVSLGVFAALAMVAGCHNDDVTGANGALARLTVDTPDNATTGQNFDIQVTAQNIGVQTSRTASSRLPSRLR